MSIENDGTDGSGQQHSESLEQIREILFGNQSRDIDVRLQQVHDRIAEAVGGLRSLIGERTDALNLKIEQEAGRLHEQLNGHQRNADARMSELDNRLNDSTNDIRQQIGSLSETLSVAERSLRNDMDSGLAELREQLFSQVEQMRDRLQHEVHQLNGATVSRRSFSEALRELSSRFDGE